MLHVVSGTVEVGVGVHSACDTVGMKGACASAAMTNEDAASRRWAEVGRHALLCGEQ